MTDAVVDRGDELVVEPVAAEPVAAPAAEPVTTEPVEPAGEAPAEPAAEAPAEPADAEEQPRADDGKFIPKAAFTQRLREQQERREAAEARAAELEKQLQALQVNEDTTKIDARIAELEDKLESARMDGNKDEALKLSKELRLIERQLRVTESTQMSERAKTEAYESMRVDIMVERLEGQYEELNPNHESYDDFLVERTLSRQAALIKTGAAPSQALKMAADETMEWYRSKVGKAEVKPETGLAAGNKAATRKEEQVRKNLDTSERQPPNMAESGKDSDQGGMKGQIDVTRLSAEEFAALPESTKAKLRGDLL